MPSRQSSIYRVALLRATAVFLAFWMQGAATKASVEASDLATVCDREAIAAAHTAGIPPDLMRALTRTETGRSTGGQSQPWPWTVNMEGTGVWFDTRQEAEAYIAQHQERGARSFDIGCFQINHRWHGDQFTSVEQMFDPQENARYAARFIRELYTEFGSWEGAVGAFHSRTPENASRYLASFRRHRERLDSYQGPAANETPTIVQPISGALFADKVSAARTPGSLVPRTNSGARALIVRN
jgi:hypothetical protein